MVKKKHVQADDVRKNKEYNTKKEEEEVLFMQNETELVDPDALPYPKNVSKIDLNRDRITYGGDDSKWIRHNFYAVAPYVGAAGVAGAVYGAPGVRSTLETFLPYMRNARIAAQEERNEKREQKIAEAAEATQKASQEKPPPLPARPGAQQEMEKALERLKEAQTVVETEKIIEQIKQLETKPMETEQISTLPREIPTLPREIPSLPSAMVDVDSTQPMEDVISGFITLPGPPQVNGRTGRTIYSGGPRNRTEEKRITGIKRPALPKKTAIKEVLAKIGKLKTNVNVINPPRITATASKVLKPLTFTAPDYFPPLGKRKAITDKPTVYNFTSKKDAPTNSKRIKFK